MGVRKPPKAPSPAPSMDDPWILRSPDGKPGPSFDKPHAFAEALKKALAEAVTIEQLYKIWGQNVSTVRLLHKFGAQHPDSKSIDGTALVAHLKSCAARLAEGTEASQIEHVTIDASPRLEIRSKIDKRALTISEPKRIRSKQHLRFVSS